MRRIVLIILFLFGVISYADAASPQQSKRAKYDHLLPYAGTMPKEERTIYYRNNSGGLASLSIKYCKNFENVQEFQASVYYTPNCQMSKGTIIYYIRKYFDSSDNGWVFREHQQWLSSRQGKNSTLFIANDWTYIKVDNHLFNIPISKAKYNELVPKASVSGGGNNSGGYSSGSRGGSSYQTGPSNIDKPCGYCGGGGGCRSCNGTGYKYNPYSGYHDRCPSCNGSGRCFNCRGTGKQATY